MTVLGRRPGWALGRFGLAGIALTLGLAGCGKQAPVPEKPEAEPRARARDTGGAANAAQPTLEARMHQPFAEATQMEPPADWHRRPPDVTATGKSVGKLYTEVVRLWDGIRFVSAAGKRLRYRAVLDTDMGRITIDFFPDLAPNHVRSFVALARAGYYDGLVFDRTPHQALPGQPDSKLELLEAGCPMGTGAIGYGSIGYWLKPELSPSANHEEGTVGACHAPEEDTGTCKFYINLCQAPFLNGSYTVFGKVTQGLDVAKNILSLPVRNDAEYPEGDRPVHPVVIRKVTIETEETE